MLNIFRANTKIVIWIIVLSFVIWGGAASVTSSDFISPYAGQVFGQKIKIRDFEKQKKVIKLFLPAQSQDIPEPAIDQEVFRQLALYQAGKKSGFKATDTEVAQTVQSFLGADVADNMQGYERWTKSALGENPRDFEETLRKIIIAQKYSRELLLAAGFKPTLTSEKLTEADKKKRDEANQEIQLKVLSDFFTKADIRIRKKD